MTDAVHIHSLVDHFFRHQSGRLVAGLARGVGRHNLGVVEDVVQGALLQALETWKIHGVPEDAAAWMYRVARNEALDVIRHRQLADRLNPELRSLQERMSEQMELDSLF